MPSAPRRVSAAICLAVVLVARLSFAQSLPAGWSHAVEVLIEETSGTALTDYQVPLTIDTQALVAASTLQPDGDDLRFTGPCTASADTPFLQYWIDPETMGTVATRVWVKVPAIPASQRTQIFMFHGNPDAAAMSAMSVFAGPIGTIAEGGATLNPSGAGANQRGYRFRPNGPLFVTHIGRNEPNGTERVITLFDFTSESIIRQVSVGGAAGVFSYTALPQPLQLEQGKSYLLEMFTPDGSNYWFGGSTTLSPAVSFQDMRYCNGCTQDTFPRNVLAGPNYGYPDMTLYWAAPRPSSEVVVTFSAALCTPTPACDADCSPAACGDGVVNLANDEECDDGNAIDTDACTSTCRTAVCGDGFVQAGVEECEDGNDDNTDLCLATCMNAFCGDGFVNPNTELCDDGNRDGGDACTNDCGPATCGDGYTYVGVEECDDGNDSIFDDCLPSCVATHCGDGILNTAAEECEDGNTRDDDGCTNACTFAFCGDGHVFARFEACDDGNALSGDGCSSSCAVEMPAQDPGTGAQPDDGNAQPDDITPPPVDPTVPADDDDGGCAATSSQSMLGGLLVIGALRRRRGQRQRR